MPTLLKFALGAIIAVTGITTFLGNTTAPQPITPIVQQTATKQITTTPTPSKTTPAPSTYKEPVKSPYQAPTPTESVRTYTNTYGNTVQSPTHYDSRPSGASAQCRDGSYSFSQSRRGTCSHHGGVAEWY